MIDVIVTPNIKSKLDLLYLIGYSVTVLIFLISINYEFVQVIHEAVEHLAIITEKAGNNFSEIKITYHSNDAFNVKISDILNAYPNSKIYAWAIKL